MPDIMPLQTEASISQEVSSSKFEILVNRFAAMVRQIGWNYRLSESDIDELVQDVRIRLWKAEKSSQLSSENIESTPASYVYRTATTAALDLIRRRRVGKADQHDSIDLVGPIHTPGDGQSGAAILEDSSTPESDLHTSEVFDQVSAAVDSIADSRRPVVRMYLQGYSREDIAEFLGWSEAKTRNLLYRGLADLREKLLERGIGPGGIA